VALARLGGNSVSVHLSALLAVGGILCVPLSVPGAHAQTTIPLDVMTFNIRTANGRDGANAWPYRKSLVADTIQRFEPHVLGLQEVVDEQIQYFEEVLPGYRWVGIDRGLNGGKGLSEFTPIFYRYDVLTPIESGNFWLTSTPETPPALAEWRGRRRRMGRIVTWARFYHLPSGRDVFVYNTHFTLRQGERQLLSANLVASRIAEHPPDSVVVLLGDFNAPAERSETWRVVLGDTLRDAWVEADEQHGPAFTLSEFGPPTDWDLGRIDWVVVGGPVGVRSVETVIHNDEGRYPSDHYPVAARLEVYTK
jgi:endonuclease/exonuclease/phosphatase family metal-dependent hydrolase